jgi:hypothetical protein
MIVNKMFPGIQKCLTRLRICANMSLGDSETSPRDEKKGGERDAGDLGAPILLP